MSFVPCFSGSLIFLRNRSHFTQIELSVLNVLFFSLTTLNIEDGDSYEKEGTKETKRKNPQFPQ